MNPRFRALHRELQAMIDEAKGLQAKEDRSPEDLLRAEALSAEIEAKREEIQKAKKLDDSIAGADKFLNDGDMRSISAEVAPALDPADRYDKAKQARLQGRASFFMEAGHSRAVAAEKAYRFGMFVQASLMGSKRALQYCKDHGIPIMSDFSASGNQVENDNEAGGVLVAPEFDNDLIVLRELYGVFRRNARVSPMSSDTKLRRRRKGGLTAYFVGEDVAGTKSKATWNMVGLTAKKLMALAIVSSELNEDSVIDIGDTLAGEIAYAFANKEDECGFNGDGTSTYGHITGVRQRLLDIWTTSGGVGLVLGTGNAYSELVLTDFEKAVGGLPQYADSGRAKWYCHKYFWATVMQKLALASGGVPAAEIVAGTARRFLGYDVEISQVMPKVEANSQVACFLGDLSMCADFGDRRQTTIAMSDSAVIGSQSVFETDELAIRGTERFDINAHDVGDGTDAGPVVGLIMAAS